MDKRKRDESDPIEGAGSSGGAGTPGSGNDRVRPRRGKSGARSGRGAVVVVVNEPVEVDKETKKVVKGAKGLTARDKNPSAGRDSQAAAQNADELLNGKKERPEPKPLVILPFESTLAYVFKGAGGKLTAIEAARMIQDEDPRLKKVVYAWDQATLRDKDTIKLEDLLAAAEITPDEFLGVIIPALWRRNIDIGKLVVAMAHPRIIEATIQAAQTQWGSLDRQMLHQASGFLPTKAGQQINIDNRKQTVVAGGKVTGVTPGPSGLPSFEQDAIEAAHAFQGKVKSLPAPQEAQEVIVPGALPAPEIIDAEPVD